MAIYQPSLNFEGGELSTNIFGKIIIDGVRQINFRDERNKQGNYFFILPPYKLDSANHGVSWKTVQVRDNFGIDPKERFAVKDTTCPINYFANQAKVLFPNYAKPEKVEVNGKTITRYPSFGRIAKKVIFNAAYIKEVTLGAHVLELPVFGAGETIYNWSRMKDEQGNDRGMINNPAAAKPVFIQLKKDAVGNPWVVQITDKDYPLPVQLSDTDYLYNLDNVVLYPSPEESIEKLRGFTPREIFNACMSGYRVNGKLVVAGVDIPKSEPQQEHSFQIPPAQVPQVVLPPPVNFPKVGEFSAPPPQVNIPKAIAPSFSPPIGQQPIAEVVPNFSNPMATNAFQSPEDIRKFLEKKA